MVPDVRGRPTGQARSPMSDRRQESAPCSDAPIARGRQDRADARQLIEIVENARSLPMSTSVRIERDEVLALLDEAVDTTARRAARGPLAAEGTRGVPGPRPGARPTRSSPRPSRNVARMVQRTEVVKAAEHRAREILDAGRGRGPPDAARGRGLLRPEAGQLPGGAGADRSHGRRRAASACRPPSRRSELGGGARGTDRPRARLDVPTDGEPDRDVGTESLIVNVVDLRRQLGERRDVTRVASSTTLTLGDIRGRGRRSRSRSTSRWSRSRAGSTVDGTIVAPWTAPAAAAWTRSTGVLEIAVRRDVRRPTTSRGRPIRSATRRSTSSRSSARRCSCRCRSAPLCREDCAGPDPDGLPRRRSRRTRWSRGATTVPRIPRWAALDVLRAEFDDDRGRRRPRRAGSRVVRRFAAAVPVRSSSPCATGADRRARPSQRRQPSSSRNTMAVPKKKMSKSKSRSRGPPRGRSTRPPRSLCPRCGAVEGALTSSAATAAGTTAARPSTSTEASLHRRSGSPEIG